MKKIEVLLLTLATLLCLSAATQASTIGVNVSKGYSVSFAKKNFNIAEYYVSGNFGVSDQLKLFLEYYPETKENQNKYNFAMRYEIMDNFAATANYLTWDADTVWSIGFRYKYYFTEPFAVVGRVDYTDDTKDVHDKNYYDLIANFQYSFNQAVTGNIGADYRFFYKLKKSVTTYTIGLECYLSRKAGFCLDYFKPNSGADGFYGAGIEFAL